MLSFTALGAMVQAPWSPDGTKGTAEQNLYQLLGFANNGAMNNKIVNQNGGGTALTAFTVDTSEATRYSSMLIELAGNAPYNSFGIYRTNATGTSAQIFAGSATPDLSPADAMKLVVKTTGGLTTVEVRKSDDTFVNSIFIGGDTDFGFYLNTGNNVFYSNGELNPDGTIIHVAAFNVQDTLYGQPPFPSNAGYILGWEDLTSGQNSDYDYQDMVVSVTRVPVPEPTTLIAGALLLLPFGASTLRILRKPRAA